MSASSQSVSSFLSASPHARALAQMDLGFGLSTTIWCNRNDVVTYAAPKGHTFSLYLRGGDGTWRTDGVPTHGWPGAVCVMPQGQTSVWNITKPFVFMHLYVPDEELRRCFAELFDKDARQMELADRTFVEAEQLAAPFQALLDNVRCGETALAEEATVNLIAAILSCGRFGKNRQLRLSGGLGPKHLKQVQAFIEDNLDQPLRLRDLSGIASLSEFHLQRSFRETCGVSPQRWIAHRRIERAKELIRTGETLQQVAVACGYSSQSHLSRAFRKGTGVTPKQFSQEAASTRRVF